MTIKRMIEEYNVPFLVRKNGDAFPLKSSDIHIAHDGTECANVCTFGPIKYICIDEFSVRNTINMPINKILMGDISNKMEW